jgi:hypothetical protein
MTTDVSTSKRTAEPITSARRVAATVCLCAALVVGEGMAADPGGEVKSVEKKNADRLFELHLEDAAQYEIFRDQAHTQKLELRRQPVYLWSNHRRNH